MLFEKEKRDEKKLLRTLKCGIAVGVVLFLATTFQQFGIVLTQNVGKSGFISGLYTVFVPIVSGIIYRQKKGINVWIGAILATCGLFLLSVSDGFSVEAGDIVLLISAFCWTAQILMIDAFVDKVSPLKFSMVQFGTCGVLGLLFGMFFNTDTMNMVAISSAIIPLLYGGLMSVGIAYTLQIVAQKNADPTTAAIIFSTESLFATVGGALILHETMTTRGYIGCATIFCALVISQISFKKSPKKIKENEDE
jgi:drug/metabolite transporter (DMT)-like permease